MCFRPGFGGMRMKHSPELLDIAQQTLRAKSIYVSQKYVNGYYLDTDLSSCDDVLYDLSL